MLYIYFIVKLPGDMNRNVVVILSALIGLCVDLFEYTLGLNMLACLVTGFMRHYYLRLFAPRDIFESFIPSFSSFGQALFLRYAIAMTFTFMVMLFTVESLSLFDPLTLTFRIAGSFILTLLLICAFESIQSGISKK
jgi:rod shape-determining protein MreD